MDRVAFSPIEFAALFGKSQTWGYRQIYAGKVKAITEHGRILIPSAEVEAILSKAGIYDGIKQKRPKTKAEIEALKPKLGGAWQRFLSRRRRPALLPPEALSVEKTVNPTSRAAAIARLTRKKCVRDHKRQPAAPGRRRRQARDSSP